LSGRPPEIGTRACLIVSKVVPGVAAFAIVLAHGAPLAFTEVGSPALPGHGGVLSGVEANVFCRH
jgi:hypothetical protein